ncbi:hypothetical protein ABID76_003536 [Burkholderia ambifaria]
MFRHRTKARTLSERVFGRSVSSSFAKRDRDAASNPAAQRRRVCRQATQP